MTQDSPIPINYESQQQRWIKYGANVVLACVIVIVLACIVVYAAEKKPLRMDTTAAGLYSLKPQTINLIKNNKQKITIISLYTKAKTGDATDVTAEDTDTTGEKPVDQAGVVSDLLEEYRTRGNNIETETIDPLVNTGKVENLINEISEQYGGEIKKYKAFADGLPAKYAEINKLAAPELEKIKALPLNEIQSDDVANAVQLAVISVRDIPRMMKQAQDDYQHALKQKPPDYKGITDSVLQTMQGLSEVLARVTQDYGHFKDDKAVPDAIRKYMADSIPRYLQIKKQADDLIAEQKKLGELKLDTLRDALKQKNSILIRGEKEWRVIPYEKVWRTDARDMRSHGDGPPRPRFAGEQMITTAILALNQPTKMKVCFIRNGGPPITEFGGRLNSVADRLRDYNFDVSEKDLSGTWAMQAMQQQQEAAPEPSEQDIADAVWIVDGVPAQQNPMMGGPPPSSAAKIADHLAHGKHWVDGKQVDGGSAFLLFVQHGDDMTGAISPFGITARTDAMAVHPLIKSEGAPPTDIVAMAQHNPIFFTINDWGDHLITNSLTSLRGILIQAVPMQVKPTDGVTSKPLIPVPGAPSAPPCWGEVDTTSIDAGPKFHDGDIAPPLYAGAAAEKGGQRVVCMGSEPSFIGSTGDLSNNIVDFPDQQMLEKQRIIVPEFPGDAEFFMNTVFWLSHEETMIAISPAAMTVSRIREMSAPVQSFWHIGVLLVGLPGLVLCAGAMVYFSRRD